jgi:pSer/pThr/pTyr-binding forkhead associated (FHA) protein
MSLLHKLIGRTRQLDQVRFTRAYAGTYLLCTFPEESEDRYSFTTGVINPEELARITQGKPDRSLSNLTLEKIEKTERNDWKRHISVGRAPNNDLVIRHPSVSKLHAHIRHATYQGSGPANATPLLLEDVGSSNGTKIDGQPLDEGVAVIIRDFTHITFGEIAAEVLESRSLFVALRGLDAHPLL